jgi:outer membrane protein OmpA-like peptidoglycan-associated protein
MPPRRTLAISSGFLMFCLAIVSCATMKNVRDAIAPVQNQANKTRDQVGALQKEADANKQSIGELDREIATTSEKADDANKKATEAAAAAASAASAAADAKQRADAADALARELQTKLDRSLQHLDNYTLLATEQIFFAVNRTSLTKEEDEKLDAVIAKLDKIKGYVVEVAGYADSTGDRAHNLEISSKRADEVVHYLVQHDVELRAIRQLGVGSDFPGADNKTREARKMNRRVDVKIYVRDVTGEGRTS